MFSMLFIFCAGCRHEIRRKTQNLYIFVNKPLCFSILYQLESIFISYNESIQIYNELPSMADYESIIKHYIENGMYLEVLNELSNHVSHFSLLPLFVIIFHNSDNLIIIVTLKASQINDLPHLQVLPCSHPTTVQAHC